MRCGAVPCKYTVGDTIKAKLKTKARRKTATTPTIAATLNGAGRVLQVVLMVPAGERVAVSAGYDQLFASFGSLLRWRVLAADHVALAGSVEYGVPSRR